MFFIESIAIDNILESYKARFREDDISHGYLFNKDDYGHGVPCSNEKYNTYVDEFELFLQQKSRFMLWWFVGMLIVASLGFFIAIKYDIVKSLENYNWIGAVWMLLPLLYILPEGWRLYQKPSLELISNEIGRVKQSREVIINKRIRGMSYKIPIIGGIFSALGWYFDVYQIGGGYKSPYMRYFFEVTLFVFLWLGVKKYLAHQKEDKG